MTNSLEIVERYTYLLNYKRTAISWHLRKQIGGNCLPFVLVPASQEDKYKDKKIKKYQGFSKFFVLPPHFKK